MATNPDPGRALVVLAVDSEPSRLLLLRLELGAFGYSVLMATSREDALAYAAAGAVDVAVCDVPRSDEAAVDLALQLKNEHRLPVVILTTLRGTDSQEQRLKAAADAVVLKPYLIEDVIAGIELGLG